MFPHLLSLSHCTSCSFSLPQLFFYYQKKKKRYLLWQQKSTSPATIASSSSFTGSAYALIALPFFSSTVQWSITLPKLQATTFCCQAAILTPSPATGFIRKEAVKREENLPSCRCLCSNLMLPSTLQWSLPVVLNWVRCFAFSRFCFDTDRLGNPLAPVAKGHRMQRLAELPAPEPSAMQRGESTVQ